ncbi:MAG: transporter [Gordonia polyisoprenivorans]|nr:transporter [Gordonia polyisoprenivorans]
MVVLIVGYIIAKVIKSVADKLLDKTKVDHRLQRGIAGAWVANLSPGNKPSHLIGAVLFWVVFLFALSSAIGTLQIPALTSFMDRVLAYLPNVIAALAIFVVAALLAGLLVTAVQKTMGDTPTGKLVATVVPGLIMAVAVFMILTQLGIASQIVIITYTALIGMLALAGALAFGLGGREVAAQMWSNAYDKSREQAHQARGDARRGRQRAQDHLGGYRDDPTNVQPTTGQHAQPPTYRQTPPTEPGNAGWRPDHLGPDNRF